MATVFSSNQNEVYHLIKSLNGRQILGSRSAREVVTLRDGDTIQRSLQVLQEADIQSAPVLTQTPSGEVSVIGIVEKLDMLAYLLSKLPEDTAQVDVEALRAVWTEEVDLRLVMGFSRRNPFVPLYQNVPAPQLVEVFASGVHRCALFGSDAQGDEFRARTIERRLSNASLNESAVLDATSDEIERPTIGGDESAAAGAVIGDMGGVGSRRSSAGSRRSSRRGSNSSSHERRLSGGSTSSAEHADEMEVQFSCVLTQGDIVRFLAARADQLPIIARQNLDRLGFLATEVQRVFESDSALVALRLMTQRRLTQIAVVNSSGELIGTFSEDSLHQLTPESVGDLLLPVREYLERYHTDDLSVEDTKSTILFGTLLSDFATKHKHYRWIVNADRRPVGIVTQTDLLRFALKFTATPQELELQMHSNSLLPLPGTLIISVKRALSVVNNRLMSNPDPYATVAFPGEADLDTPVVMRTEPRPSTQNPVFNAEFKVRIVPAMLRRVNDIKLVIELWDKGSLISEDFLGRVVFQLRWILDGFGVGNAANRSTSDTFRLSGVDHGQLEVELNYVADA